MRSCPSEYEESLPSGAAEAHIPSSDEQPVYVNPFLRYSEIFCDSLFSDNHLNNATLNIITHYLALSERLYGDALMNAYLICIEEDILNCKYGENVKDDYLTLTNQHKNCITNINANKKAEKRQSLPPL